MHLLFPKHLSRLLGHDWGARALLSCPQLAEKACVDHFLYGGEQTFLWNAATRVINEVINQYGHPFLPVRDNKNILQTDGVLIYSSRFIVFRLDRCDFDLLIRLLILCSVSCPVLQTEPVFQNGGGGHEWICSRDRRQLLEPPPKAPASLSCHVC